MAFTVLGDEYMAECRRRADAGEPMPGSALPAGGGDLGWLTAAPDGLTPGLAS